MRDNGVGPPLSLMMRELAISALGMIISRSLSVRMRKSHGGNLAAIAAVEIDVIPDLVRCIGDAGNTNQQTDWPAYGERQNR